MDHRITFHKEMEFSDVVFNIINEDPAKEPVQVKAHKLILASVSQVFKAMFYGDLKEGDTVEIKDSNPTAFKNMIKYIYMHEFDYGSTSILKDTMYLANKYMINHLENMIIKKIGSQEVETYNVDDLVQFGEMYDESLTDKCAMFLQCLKFEDIKFTPTLWKFALDYNMNFGKTPENLFIALLNWAQNQTPKQKLDRDLLLYFPLTSLAYEDLVKQVLTLDQFTAEEFVEIQKAKARITGGPWAQFLKKRKRDRISEVTLQCSRIGNFNEIKIEPSNNMYLKYVQYHWSKDSISNNFCTRQKHSNPSVKCMDGTEIKLYHFKEKEVGNDLYRSSDPVYLKIYETYVLSVNTFLRSEAREQKPGNLWGENSRFCKSESVKLSKRNACCDKCKCYIDEVCFVKMDEQQ